MAVVLCGSIVACAAIYALAVGIEQMVSGTEAGDSPDSEHGVLNWLDFLYFLSYVKVMRGVRDRPFSLTTVTRQRFVLREPGLHTDGQGRLSVYS